jgi:hypothetical protein
MGNGGGSGDKTKTKATGGLTGREPSSSSHASKRRRGLRGESMADRFIPNDFPDFVAEAEASDGEGHRPAGLRGLLSLPYTRLSDHFVRAARRLKDKVRGGGAAPPPAPPPPGRLDGPKARNQARLGTLSFSILFLFFPNPVQIQTHFLIFQIPKCQS